MIKLAYLVAVTYVGYCLVLFVDNVIKEVKEISSVVKDSVEKAADQLRSDEKLKDASIDKRVA